MVIIGGLGSKIQFNDDMKISKSNHGLSVVQMRETHYFIKHCNCKVWGNISQVRIIG